MWHWLVQFMHALGFGAAPYNRSGIIPRLMHFLGIDTTTGRFYAFWSGAGSDLGELALAVPLIAMIRARNCEVHRCWRLGRHATAARHRVCRRHHPDGHLTVHGVREAHHLYLGSRPGRG